MDIKPVKIFAVSDSPRLRYIAGVILGDILGLDWDITTDKRKLGKNPVINYSTEELKGGFKICPASLLFEKGITAKDITVDRWKGIPVFFQTDTSSDIPFDIFAASFYMISRYEEYLNNDPDEYGRYRAASSLAFKNGFLQMPVVDLWAKELSKVLVTKFPFLAFRRNEYKSVLTIDTDEPFAYLGKNLLRSVGGIFKDLVNKKDGPSDRMKVMTHTIKDPYQIYDYIEENITRHNIKAVFFFPTGDRTKYDNNPAWRNEEYRRLIARISGKFEIGMHPSFNATTNLVLIQKELKRLYNIAAKEISSSRFHFLRLLIPESYRTLMKAGIREDYSMGYPDEPGFRAGIARPYYFYDIHHDEQTDLKIIPFQVMDCTFYKYKKLDTAASSEIIHQLIDETRKAGGLFISIWHNTSLLESPEWHGWREVFESMLKKQRP